ncbi:hypothetical protein [Capnocytophaga felis]|uniref:Uncharacterized protein n=1 Tax=Capnocytophaga felis TaxID=2267611 RepID=A0A5M4B857_9FLAO|nr:hypothetical protein [Capnocytophaga felis]GET45442.1 hypothetical protein RCZ01_07440 [Capnocytophaga felis]GET47395.1 hypothetical protein RCZ02_02260 [Capnocytophaga felis]
MKQTILNELHSTIGDETIDFYVFAERKVPRVVSVFFVFFAIFWLLVTLSFGSVFFDDFGRGNAFFEVMNGFALTQIGIFVFIGAVLLVWGVITFFQNGGHFIGTPTRLIHYKRGTTKIYPWSDFTGNMDFNTKQRYITFYLHSDKKEKRDNKTYMICRSVHLFSAKNVLEIAKITYQRITENKDLNKYIF